MVLHSDPLAPAGPRIGARAVPFARELAAHGDRTAIITADGELSYRDLAGRVAATARRLGTEPRLVLLACANEVDSIVVYLAALAGGHPVVLVSGDRPATIESLVTAYDPDVVARPVAGEWVLDERRHVSAHAPHPELALLLSTSGSTGSPKLVRLSHENVQANAEAIAAYLDIRDDDRAATTLPMHYCYGLSVINSHLQRGAALILTGLSVADTCFWELFGRARGTSFAGVPYTFDLLDRVGFAAMRLPHLRYVTQAGGRLTADRVSRYAALGRRNGWNLFVMYGQTEATARMAYLPPRLAQVHPQAIGIPIPGGSFHLQPVPDWPDPDIGELVYAGPNVMLGYAERRADLGLGRTVDELRTGDIARRTGDGLYEIVGRRSRFAKVLGLRIDPHQVEAALARSGVTAACVGTDDALVVAATGDDDAATVRRLATDACGLPPRAVRVRLLADLPRLPTGKPDYEAIRAATGRGADEADSAEPGGAGRPAASDPGTGDLRRLYAEILDRTDVTDDSSFVGLGGDSLSYVEMSLRLEQLLGHLPAGWHTMPIRDLRPARRRSVRRGSVLRLRTVEISVVLRALAIVFVVGTHIALFNVSGGAHLLLGVAGFNFARFHLTDAARLDRVRAVRRSIARIAVPSVAWILGAFLLTDDYGPANVFLLNSVFGPRPGDSEWHFWFIEAIVYILVVALAVLALPVVDRLERRFPYGLPMGVVALGLVTRYDLLGLDDHVRLPSAVRVFWLFALGWAAAKATTNWQRLAVTGAAVATLPGAFGGDRQRETIITVGLILLVWVRGVPSLGLLNRLAGVLAASSLYIYLTHWQVYPRVDDHSRWLALLASLAVGIAYAAVVRRAAPFGRRWIDHTRRQVRRSSARRRPGASPR